MGFEHARFEAAAHLKPPAGDSDGDARSITPARAAEELWAAARTMTAREVRAVAEEALASAAPPVRHFVNFV